ncbi:MAG: PilN domain-containing protein [Desulfovermiculus sp.]|nr:PilN domain-containing protein [Desulfovermiculus sp.]
MLTINLLPHKKRGRTSDSRKQILLLILLLLLAGTGIIQAKQMLSAKIDRLDQELQSKTATQQELRKQIAQIRDLQNKLKELDQRVAIIRRIREHQALPVRYLDEIARHVPGDKMWFDSLSMDNQGRMTLSGVALDNQVFARYLRRLRGSPYISDISLQQTQRKTIQNLNLVAFRCSLSATDKHPASGEGHG